MHNNKNKTKTNQGMNSVIKLFCLFSSVWHVRSASTTIPMTLLTHTDDNAYESMSISNIQFDIQTPNLDDYCWFDQLETCNIIGNFTRTTIGLSFPVRIDCSQQPTNESNKLQRATHFDQYLFERFQHIEVISLNGCGINVATNELKGITKNSFGLEYIPDPLSVRHLTLEMFKLLGDINGQAFTQFKNTKTILLTNNKINGLNESSFEGLNLLEELILQENSIQLIHASAFKPFNESLRRLVIQESRLKLGRLEPLNKIEQLIVSTQQINWTALTIGVKSLNSAVISKVSEVIFNSTEKPRTFNNLTNLDVTFCDLKDFPIDRYPRLVRFNISHNALRNISIKDMQMLSVQTLDISYNNFTSIDGVLLSSLWDLEYFYAAHNIIIGLNPKAFQQNYNLKQIDLRSNRLKRLTIDPALFLSARHVKLIIDGNPFNCAWVNEYYGFDPHIFSSKLVYHMEYLDVNIKGLKCFYYGNDYRYHSHLYDADDQMHNGLKARRPNHPVEILRRNPKHTAMITIFILIIGVSCLLIGLYFYVKYRNLTSTLHQHPIYETLSEKRRKSINDSLENRPDIIQDRILSAKWFETQKRQSIVSTSTLDPRSVSSRSGGSIEFKDSADRISETPRTSLTNRIEAMPIGSQKVVFNIGSDTLVH